MKVKNSPYLFQLILIFLFLLLRPYNNFEGLLSPWGILFFIIEVFLAVASVFFLVAGFVRAPYKKVFLYEYLPDLIFSLFILFFFSLNIFFYGSSWGLLYSDLIILFSVFSVIFRIFKTHFETSKISSFWKKFSANPPLTILLSFVFVIALGTVLLSMGFSTKDGRGLPFLDALFTSTSAVCVTGLIVTDTAITFSVFGKIVLLILLQIGGLGFMILSFFSLYLLIRKIPLSNKVLLSYLLSDDDMHNIHKVLRSIIAITFSIEGAGAVLLFAGFSGRGVPIPERIFHSVFHSVSAFCNGGFSLFSDNLESFSQSPLVLCTIAFLIISGGLSFSVIINLGIFFKALFRRKSLKGILSFNSKLVISGTVFLIIFGTLVIYYLEFTNSLKDFNLGNQYLNAFFQSVTLRTAGFNSIPFSTLTEATYFIMMVLMFIGAASGSTGGGIKINTVWVLLAAVKSFRRGQSSTTLGKYSIPPQKVRDAFIILLSAIFISFAAIFILSITERKPLVHIMFEVFSALSTSGVSAGITPLLTAPGKIIIILLMFIGRTGAITILSAGKKDVETKVFLPQTEISIG